MNYRSDIDGIRAIALIPVILFHANPHLIPNGYLGVDIFFVISGFLITTIIINELEKQNFSILKFYERRARRILPMLFTIILVSLPFAWSLMLPNQLKDFAYSTLSVNSFISNFYFWSLNGYFDHSNELRPLLHTWSLSIEEQYYLFAPLVLMVLWRFGFAKLKLIWWLIFLVSLALNYWAFVMHANATFYLLPFRAWELSLGAIASFIFIEINKYGDLKFPSWLNQALSMLGLLLVILAYYPPDFISGQLRVIALPATVGVTLMILFGENTLVGRLMSIKPLVFVGLISYGAYLWHQPVFAFYRLAYGENVLFYEYSLLVAGTLIISYFSWRYIEQPFRDKVRFSQNKIFALSALFTVICVVISLLTVKANGFSTRYAVTDRELVELDINVAGDYVKKIFLEREMKPFNNVANKKKLLVIGDSYGEDLVNAIFESNLNDRYEVSTRFINTICGNLFVPFDQINHYIVNDKKQFCESKSLLKDNELKSRMKEADEIWIASAWHLWQLNFILDSIKYIDQYGKKIKVFSSKDFGVIDVKSLLKVPFKDRINYENDVSVSSKTVNQILKKIITKNQLVDTHALICGVDENRCRIFNDSGELISFDGGHLTKNGARHFGKQLELSAALD